MTSVGGVPLAAPPGVRCADATDRATVADAMITDVRITRFCATVREVRTLFGHDRVHAAVVVHDGVLLAVVERSDLAGADDGAPAVLLGRLGTRVVAPDADLATARLRMVDAGNRRLAVAAPDGTFLGLLCLKRTGRGFCSDTDVRGARNALRAMSHS